MDRKEERITPIGESDSSSGAIVRKTSIKIPLSERMRELYKWRE